MGKITKTIIMVATIIMGISSFRHFPKSAVVFGTSLVGSGLLIIGISYYAGSLPNMFADTDTPHGRLSSIGVAFIFYQLSLTVLTLIGSYY